MCDQREQFFPVIKKFDEIIKFLNCWFHISKLIKSEIEKYNANSSKEFYKFIEELQISNSTKHFNHYLKLLLKFYKDKKN